MSTRYEGFDARFTSVEVVTAGAWVGEDKILDPAVCFIGNEVAYITGSSTRLRELLTTALAQLDELTTTEPPAAQPAPVADPSTEQPWVATLTVEYHASPPLPEALARQMLGETVDAVSAIGYVSSSQIRKDRT